MAIEKSTRSMSVYVRLIHIKILNIPPVQAHYVVIHYSIGSARMLLNSLIPKSTIQFGVYKSSDISLRSTSLP